MISSLTALHTARTNYTRSLALLLNLLLLTATLPVSSLSRTAKPQVTAHSTANSSTSTADRLITEASASDGSAQTTTADQPTQEARVAEAYSKLPLSFEVNQGQFNPQVQFMARGGGYGLFLTASEAVLVLTKPAATKEKGRLKSPSTLHAKTSGAAAEGENGAAEGTERGQDVKAAKPESTVLRLKLEGANPLAQVHGMDQLPGQTNYLIGNDPQQWHTEIPSYARVMYREVYPGIDLVYYGRGQQLEYDFVVAPGVDPNNIKLVFEGAQSIEVDAGGDLVLHTEAGEVRQHKPVVYQEVEGVKREIMSRYVLKDSERVGFQVEAYDASKPLVIDPVLTYSTFLGGSANEAGNGIAVDAAGHAYVTGRTTSFNFPIVTPVDIGGGAASDAFVTKLNASGSAIVYSTYLGGSNTDISLSIAIDRRGYAYVTGYTFSTDFPTVNPLQATLNGKDDVFIAKLTPQGSALTYSTYFGASSYEAGYEVKADADGNAYLTGFTFSHDFTTVTPYQATKAGHQAYKSTNSGGDWSPSDTGLSAARMGDLAVDPSNPATLYAATEKGIYKSTDSGSTWDAINTNFDTYSDAVRVVVDPVHTSTVWAATTGRLYKSTNGGKTWTGNLQGYIESLAINPVNSSIIYAGMFGQLLKSTDGGNTWNSQVGTYPGYSPHNVTALAINRATPSTVYAGTYFDGIYKSTDSGVHWTQVNTGLPAGQYSYTRIHELILNPSNPSTIYAATAMGVYKSTNGGGNWSAASDGLPNRSAVLALAIDRVNVSTIYAGTNGKGLFKSTNGGGSWSPSEAGLNNRIIKDIGIDPTTTSKVFAVTDSLGDGFVMKLNSAGSAILYSTFLGGNEYDAGHGIALDDDGHAYLTGRTASTNFPTVSPFQASHASPGSSFEYDGFVTKLDASGTNLAYSSYLGGSGIEQGMDITTDSAGNAYVVGFAAQVDPATPMNFPTTPGSFQTAFNTNSYADAFVTKVNAAGSDLVYSTFLGGNSADYAYSIAVNSSGHAFITGETFSSNFPVRGATQTQLNGGYVDAFVTRLNATGSGPVFSTYLGGYGEEQGIAIDTDPVGSNIYVTGITRSYDFPTINALDESVSGNSDAFVSKFSPPLASVRISGRVILNDAGLGGVTVTLTGSGGFAPRTVVTGSGGGYSFDNLPGRRNYKITPSKRGYAFVPASRSYTNLGTNLTNQNFSANAVYYYIQVAAEDIYGPGLWGVKFTLTGTRTATCVTDYSGYCFFGELPEGGNYTVTPSKSGATFTPASRVYNNLSENQYASFKVGFNIKGRITGFNNTGVSGVLVNLTGYRALTKITDSNGEYVFDNVPAGGGYTVTPLKTGMTFNPASKEIYYLAGSQMANFQARVSITGKVRLTGTSTGLGGVTVKLTGSRADSMTTNADGFYTFSNLPAGGNYTVTPSKSGYTFDPPSRTFNGLNTSPAPTNTIFNATQTMTINDEEIIDLDTSYLSPVVAHLYRMINLLAG